MFYEAREKVIEFLMVIQPLYLKLKMDYLMEKETKC